MNVISFSGHRPSRLPDGFAVGGNKIIIEYVFASIIAKIMNGKEEWSSVTLMSGGALGFDQLALEASYRAKIFLGKQYNIQVVIAEPFNNFWSPWPAASQQRYMELRELADQIIEVSNPPYSIDKLFKRNTFMVDACSELWVYWDGGMGGTSGAISYARAQNKPIINLYDEMKSIRLI